MLNTAKARMVLSDDKRVDFRIGSIDLTFEDGSRKVLNLTRVEYAAWIAAMKETTPEK